MSKDDTAEIEPSENNRGFSPGKSLHQITRLSTIYTSTNKGTRIWGIPVLIISFLYAVYTYGGITPLYPPITQDPIWLVLSIFAVGLIAPDEFEGARFVILGRVSTQAQLRNADFEDRLQPIRDHAIQEQNGEVVKEFTGSESGATMERENLEEILEMAKTGQYDVLAVRNIDRLSRAEPWETINYLLDLQEAGITLYEDPQQYFSWDDLNDFQLLSQKMFFSREWHQRLSEGRRDGVIKELNKGRWPLKPHLGYQKDDEAGKKERNIYFDESKREVLYRIFDIYEKTQNIAKTFREVEDRFGSEIEEEITKSKVQTVLSSRLCIGQLTYEGTVYHEIDDLAVVSGDKFWNVQSLLESQSRDEPDKIPEPVADVTTKLGIEYAQSILDQISFRQCKKCGGQLKPYSKTELFGIPVEKVRCEECDYDGPLISAKEYREIHMTAPLSCPFCYQSGNFDVNTSQHGLNMYKYECGNCDRQFHTSVGPGKIKRYLNNPDLGINLNEDSNENKSQSSSNSTDQTSEGQATLSEL